MKKKALIVTVYNSQNSGSFLQAFAMHAILTKLGLDVGFYKRNDSESSHSKRIVIARCIKKMRSLKFGEAINELCVWFTFNHLLKRFSIYDKNSSFYNQTEYVILGSDTIWNFDKSYFRSHADIFLGSSFEGKKVFSYAVSAANTSADIFNSVVEKYGLQHLSTILVRDAYTKDLVEGVAGREAKIVTDPTLLLDKSDYAPLYQTIDISVPYLLLYYFGDISTEIQNAIISYASSHNLKVVSMPYVRKWCDMSRNQDPRNMVSYFQHAAAVITNTFHGCALSLVFEKPFAVHNEGKNKITSFLNLYHESDRYFEFADQIPALLEKQNTVKTSNIYKEIQETSINLIKKEINI